jgi:hypothetical protein
MVINCFHFFHQCWISILFHFTIVVFFASDLRNTRIATKLFNKFQQKFLRPRCHSTNYRITVQVPKYHVLSNQKWGTTRNCTEQTLREQQQLSNWPAVSSHTCVSSATSAGRPEELMRFQYANSPNDLPAGSTIHVRSAFQVWTVQADLKAKLYMYRGA